MAEGLLSAGDKGTNSVAGRAVRYADELIEVLQQRQQPQAKGINHNNLPAVSQEEPNDCRYQPTSRKSITHVN